MATLDNLTEAYQNWIEQEGLPLMSADELLCEDFLTADQTSWLRGFMEEWGEAEDA